ncbi:MAG: phosphate ABC transporter permease subunit PstC [Nitrospinae bacterium]|nr:phosphate ABC transporter permease subunit PstC [Nitrospinota bacterium]
MDKESYGMKWFFAGLNFIFLCCTGGLFFFLFVESYPVIQHQGFDFWLGQDWWVGETYGALPMLYGSIFVTALACFLVLPPALAIALFTSEFLSSPIRRIVKGILELLAGVPGIVYGLLGVSFLSLWVKNIFALSDGNTLATAGCLLSIMILPTVLTLSEDALRAVPAKYRENALALGLSKWQTAIAVVLPQALPGIMGAVLLGIGRAMGETIAVMLVVGGLDRIPHPWFNIFSSAQTIPSKLGREAAESIGEGMHWSALMALGLTLFFMVFLITYTGNRFLKRESLT